MNEILSTRDFYFRSDLIAGYEYILLPFYIFILYFLTRIITWKFYRYDRYNVYILPTVCLKVFGGIFICLVYNYYYQGGDTSTYYINANNLTKIFLHDPIAGMRIFFSSAGNFPAEYDYILSKFNYIQTEDTYMVVRVAAVLQLFAFNSFIITSVLFGYISFWAVWQLYVLFVKIYPDLYKQLAYSILFIPSMIAWGSGILKDTITLSALCILVPIAYNYILKNRISLKNIFFTLVAAVLLAMIKAYILIAIIPSLILLKIRLIPYTVKNKAVLVLMTPLFFVFLIALTAFFMGSINNYSDSILEKSRIQREYLYSISKEIGSGYTLGTIDTPVDLLLNFPAAVNVTFFRPYIWESYNIIMFMSALESLAIFLITFFCLTKYGVINSFKVIKNDPIIVFCLTFALLFGFFVGISTYNFGSLVRYKIPALPFYLTAITIIYYTKKKIFLKNKLK